MNLRPEPNRSIIAESIYGLLNPIPFGCFVAALIFDIIYSETAVMLWDKGAAWLIVFGLLFAVVPRLVNLAQVWVTSRHTATRTDKLDFWLNLLRDSRGYRQRVRAQPRCLCGGPDWHLALGLHRHSPVHRPHHRGRGARNPGRIRP